jgi:hypothetical protein
MADVFEKPEDLSDYLFRIVDNGGSTADRYTVVFCDGSYLGMSSSPTHPQGVSMWGEDIDPQVLEDWVEEGSAIDLALGDLPKHLVDHILFRNNEGLEDFLEAVEQKLPQAVSSTRDAATANEGGYDTLGKGIYLEDGKYMVKMDGGPDDRGPFDTAREAILNTMPDQYSLAGPEYHSSVDDLMRMTPDPVVLASVKALEERRDREWREELDRPR